MTLEGVPTRLLHLISSFSKGVPRGSSVTKILQGNYRHPGTLSHHHQSPSGCCPALTTDILAKLPSPRDSLFQRYSSQPEGQRDTRHHTKASEKCLESWENEPTISKQKRRQLSGQNRKEPHPCGMKRWRDRSA